MRRHKHFFNTLKPIFIGKEAGAGEKKYLEPEYKSVLDHIYPSKLLLMSCLTQEQGFLFCLPKRCSRSRLKKCGSGSDQPKNRLRLRNTEFKGIKIWEKVILKGYFFAVFYFDNLLEKKRLRYKFLFKNEKVINIFIQENIQKLSAKWFVYILKIDI